MWKNYSLSYLKNNRSSGMSVMIAAFISALLLSLLCGLFYNAWKYEIERIELEEGGWQSRLVGELNQEDAESIKKFANVRDVVLNERETDGAGAVVDIYFRDMRYVFADTPQIAQAVDILPEAVQYHYELLAMYLIRSPQDTAPRLLFPMFIIITILASVSLIIIIHNAFAVSMNTRVHQFGIFSSIGATPKQIKTCLLQEAAALCAVPVLIGNLMGIFISMGLLQMANVLLGSDAAGRHEAVFGYHPLVLGLTMLLTVITIWVSAWLPARNLSRLTPLEAIKNTEELQLKRRRKSPVLTLLFGMEGELAGNALKVQRKALRTASLSFLFSFLAFTMMQCFFTLSQISTRETYFERYQDVWDIMVTVKNAEVDSFGETEQIQGLSGVESAVVYQKAMAKRIITEDEMSDEMKSFGGFSYASSNVTQTDTGWRVNAPIIIMDDVSFLAYCEQIGIVPQLNGAVILNRIRDVTNPDFRHPNYMPYVKGENATSILWQLGEEERQSGEEERQSGKEERQYGKEGKQSGEEGKQSGDEEKQSDEEEKQSDDEEKQSGDEEKQSGGEEMMAEIPVLSYTQETPVLREEYATLDYYELVHFIPASLWREIKGQVAGNEEEVYIRILGRENATLTQLTYLQNEVDRILDTDYASQSENRIQEYETNDKMIQGMMTVLGGFCILLAVIGVGNVFSNTLGFVRQRKREFARYMSVGMTSAEIRKMFCIEALVIAGRPILITLPFAVVVTWYMLKASYVEAKVFLAEAPLVPIAVFMSAILGTVALAYYLGWRNVRNIQLAEVLRDDTVM